jgi:hypothetical protein
MDKVINIFEKYSVAANNNSETGLKYWWAYQYYFLSRLA